MWIRNNKYRDCALVIGCILVHFAQLRSQGVGKTVAAQVPEKQTRSLIPMKEVLVAPARTIDGVGGQKVVRPERKVWTWADKDAIARAASDNGCKVVGVSKLDSLYSSATVPVKETTFSSVARANDFAQPPDGFKFVTAHDVAAKVFTVDVGVWPPSTVRHAYQDKVPSLESSIAYCREALKAELPFVSKSLTSIISDKLAKDRIEKLVNELAGPGPAEDWFMMSDGFVDLIWGQVDPNVWLQVTASPGSTVLVSMQSAEVGWYDELTKVANSRK